jgi:hypothetical protein
MTRSRQPHASEQRRALVLRNLIAAYGSASSAEHADRGACRLLTDNARDTRFAVLYLLSSDRACAKRVGVAGVGPRAASRPTSIRMTKRQTGSPFARAARGGRMMTPLPLEGIFGFSTQASQSKTTRRCWCCQSHFQGKSWRRLSTR